MHSIVATTHRVIGACSGFHLVLKYGLLRGVPACGCDKGRVFVVLVPARCEVRCAANCNFLLDYLCEMVVTAAVDRTGSRTFSITVALRAVPIADRSDIL